MEINNNIPKFLLNFKKDIIIIINQNKNQEERLAKIEGEIKNLKTNNNSSNISNNQKNKIKLRIYKRVLDKSIREQFNNNNTQKLKNPNNNIHELSFQINIKEEISILTNNEENYENIELIASKENNKNLESKEYNLNSNNIDEANVKNIAKLKIKKIKKGEILQNNGN